MLKGFLGIAGSAGTAATTAGAKGDVVVEDVAEAAVVEAAGFGLGVPPKNDVISPFALGFFVGVRASVALRLRLLFILTYRYGCKKSKNYVAENA